MDTFGIVSPLHVHFIDVICGVALEERVVGVLVHQDQSNVPMHLNYSLNYHALVRIFYRHCILTLLQSL